MTEDMEKKLNELLGLKKQLEELTDQKKKTDNEILQQYKNQSTRSKIIYNACGAAGTVLVVGGIIGLFFATSTTQIFSLVIAISGWLIVLNGELNFRITQSKLSVLQEMKQMELRITELLQKK